MSSRSGRLSPLAENKQLPKRRACRSVLQRARRHHQRSHDHWRRRICELSAATTIWACQAIRRSSKRPARRCQFGTSVSASRLVSGRKRFTSNSNGPSPISSAPKTQSCLWADIRPTRRRSAICLVRAISFCTTPSRTTASCRAPCSPGPPSRRSPQRLARVPPHSRRGPPRIPSRADRRGRRLQHGRRLSRLAQVRRDQEKHKDLHDGRRGAFDRHDGSARSRHVGAFRHGSPRRRHVDGHAQQVVRQLRRLHRRQLGAGRIPEIHRPGIRLQRRLESAQHGCRAWLRSISCRKSRSEWPSWRRTRDCSSA